MVTAQGLGFRQLYKATEFKKILLTKQFDRFFKYYQTTEFAKFRRPFSKVGLTVFL